MPNEYVVGWGKTYYACGEVNVEANSSEEAEALVRERMGDYEGHMEYEPDKDFVSIQKEIPEQERIPEYFRKLVTKMDEEEHVCDVGDKWCQEGANPARHPDHDSHVGGCNCELKKESN